jgi:2'-5' RNA ligase
VRLFVAIKIPEEIRGVLAAFIKELRPIAPQAKWVRAENLHVTLKFLGHTEETKRSAIEAALQQVRSPEPVHLDFRGLGFFPSENHPRVFWAGMECSPNLKVLASDVEHAVHKLGFSLEDRPFTPHLTLARLEAARMAHAFAHAIAANAAQSFGSTITSEFHLIKSSLKPAGAEYTTLHTFPFAGASQF